jgi:hypothetical protein
MYVSDRKIFFSELLSMTENSEQSGPTVLNQVANFICPDVDTKSHDCSHIIVSVHNLIFGGNETKYNKCTQCKIPTTYIVSLHKQN